MFNKAGCSSFNITRNTILSACFTGIAIGVVAALCDAKIRRCIRKKLFGSTPSLHQQLPSQRPVQEREIKILTQKKSLIGQKECIFFSGKRSIEIRRIFSQENSFYLSCAVVVLERLFESKDRIEPFWKVIQKANLSQVEKETVFEAITQVVDMQLEQELEVLFCDNERMERIALSIKKTVDPLSSSAELTSSKVEDVCKGLGLGMSFKGSEEEDLSITQEKLKPLPWGHLLKQEDLYSPIYPLNPTVQTLQSRIGPYFFAMGGGSKEGSFIQTRYLASSFEKEVEDRKYPIELFGVFTMFKGFNPKTFELTLQNELSRWEFKDLDKNIANALRVAFNDLKVKAPASAALLIEDSIYMATLQKDGLKLGIKKSYIEEPPFKKHFLLSEREVKEFALQEPLTKQGLKEFAEKYVHSFLSKEGAESTQVIVFQRSEVPRD